MRADRAGVRPAAAGGADPCGGGLPAVGRDLPRCQPAAGRCGRLCRRHRRARPHLRRRTGTAAARRFRAVAQTRRAYTASFIEPQEFRLRIPVRRSLLGLALLAATLPVGAAGAGQFKDLLNQANQAKQAARGSTAAPAGASLPTGDIAAGLKEALAKSTTAAISSLGRSGGYWDNATDYFRRVAGAALSARIEPIVAKATDSVGATRKYKALTSGTAGGGLGSALGSLGALGGGHPAGAGGSPLNLDDYVTAKTLDGLFATIGEQEQSIRQNPAARSTGLLKKVFGSR